MYGEEDDILYDLETSEENGDSIGLEKALKEHYKYWEKEHRKGNLRKMDGPRYQSCLDGFCIFETLFIISYNAETMDTDNFYSFFSDCAENDKKLREFFVPLSKTTELLKDENGDLIGYLSPKGDVVVYCSPWDTMFELWSYKAIDPQLSEDLKNSADVDFE